MADFTFSLSPSLQSWVDESVAEGEYADAGEFVRDVLERAHEEEVARVRALVDEGLASGIVDADPRDVLRDIIARIPRG